MSDMMKIKDVAALLNVNYRTIMTMAQKGMLPHFRIGTKAVRFRRSDIERYIEAQVTESTKKTEHTPA